MRLRHLAAVLIFLSCLACPSRAKGPYVETFDGDRLNHWTAASGQWEVADGMVRQVDDDPDTGWPPGVRGAWHQMGTTRMDREPKRGVVDEHCRVHGIANLFIAGSSVFSTSGYTNPTLTIVALALRLADHLRRVV